jgi:tetratricopeptide (TPR) repeat protein
LILTLLTAPVAIAQDTDAHARELYEQGKEAYANEDYELAIELWQKSYDLSGRPLLLYNMASAYEKLDRKREAIEMWDEYWRVAPESERTIIERRIKRLEEELGETSDPGPSPNPIPEPEPGYAGLIAPTALVGVGVAGLAVGTGFAVRSLAAGRALDGACINGLCPDTSAADLQANQTSAIVADVSSGVGVAALGSGVTLFLLRNGMRTEPVDLDPPQEAAEPAVQDTPPDPAEPEPAQ